VKAPAYAKEIFIYFHATLAFGFWLLYIGGESMGTHRGKDEG
jgi:hypothetical protein